MSAGSGAFRLMDGRPIGGSIDLAIAIFAAGIIAGNLGWIRLRMVGVVQGGALISISALLLTHVLLSNVSPLAVALLFPVLPLLLGIGLGHYYWDLSKPERLLPSAMADRAQRLPGAGWAAVKATVVLKDGRQIRHVRIYRGRVASRAAAALFDPAEVVAVLPEPSSKKS